ncbi:hypothetical protein EMIT0111MI5_100100 [Burkholderia sp. IT-111MI5]
MPSADSTIGISPCVAVATCTGCGTFAIAAGPPRPRWPPAPLAPWAALPAPGWAADVRFHGCHHSRPPMTTTASVPIISVRRGRRAAGDAGSFEGGVGFCSLSIVFCQEDGAACRESDCSWLRVGERCREGATRLGPVPSRPAREKSCAHRECGATMGMILRAVPVTVQRSIFQRVTVVTERVGTMTERLHADAPGRRAADLAGDFRDAFVQCGYDMFL